MIVHLVVTRHPELVQLLAEQGLDVSSVEVREHIGDNDLALLQGRVVAGVLPPHLMALCAEVVVADLKIPAEKRGASNLPLEELRRYFVGLAAYKVVRRSL